MEVLIVTPMGRELAERIAAQDGVELTYLPELLPTARWSGDTVGEGGVALEDPRWAEALERAEVAFGIPGNSGDGLVDLVRRARGSSGCRPATPAPASSSARRWSAPPTTPAASRSRARPASTPARWRSSRCSACSPSPSAFRP